MEPILKTVAGAYCARYSNLWDVCFLFPNKRCGVFFQKYLNDVGLKKSNHPKILTISDLVAEISGKKEADHICQLFTLYKAYLNILYRKQDREDNSSFVKEDINVSGKKEKKTISFEDFRGWGETVLSDFNTVDMYLADPNEIFKNVKDYRELTSNFLTDEQREVMREYFGVEDRNDPNEFWKKFNDTNEISELKKTFLNLWQILAPLHEKFLGLLSEDGLGTSGSLYRLAAERINEEGRGALDYKKVVAVGFNALTEAERSIFSVLRDEEGSEGFDDYIDFIWDAAGPILKSEDFSASKFINFNRKHFPEPSWWIPVMEEHDIAEWPDISIIAAPSDTAQTKVAGEVLAKFGQTERKTLLENAEMAIVLPDEGLLSNMLYSLPDGLDSINLTMGYSLHQTPVAAFVYLLRRIYATLRENKNERFYFVKDLRRLLSHPFSYVLFGRPKLETLISYLDKYHKVSVTFEELKVYLEDSACYLNFPSKKDSSDSIFRYMEVLFGSLREKLLSNAPEGSNIEEIDQLRIYSEYFHDLEDNLKKFEIDLQSLTILQIADRLIAGEKIGFEGEPLKGLQVMGTLETRSLDFKYLIVLSMNEGIMPRKDVSSTFIPESLRKGYGLPPARYAEEIFSYYFYRLLSRAEKVVLIYDGRTISGMRGGLSRYLLQLKEYAPKEKVSMEAWHFRLGAKSVYDSSVEKTHEIAAMIDLYCNDNEPRKNFSASSLNSYRECQVKFFLQNLLNINSDPERSEYMDAITVGHVLHEVMMEIYIPDKRKQRRLLEIPETITSQLIQRFIDDPELIHTLVNEKIHKYYFGESGGKKSEINSGVTELMSEQIAELVSEILKYDLKLTPFSLYGCEIEKNLRIRLASGRVVNFRFAIDRLDEIEMEGEKRMRIVDYKTGSRKRSATDLKEVFDGGYSNEQIFQLFVYAWLLGKIGVKGWEDVVIEIYFVPDLVAGNGGLPEIDKQKVTSFRPYLEEFSSRLEDMIEDIFISSIFRETKDAGLCNLCVFKSYCGK
ncbi:MAG: PD-(D/E)XK nuclease family protein [Muribaculaceae bacterium]|nr:PD-(D/E)XK nuclease family protein [Muribaculaceae bacterium]